MEFGGLADGEGDALGGELVFFAGQDFGEGFIDLRLLVRRAEVKVVRHDAGEEFSGGGCHRFRGRVPW